MTHDDALIERWRILEYQRREELSRLIAERFEQVNGIWTERPIHGLHDFNDRRDYVGSLRERTDD